MFNLVSWLVYCFWLCQLFALKILQLSLKEKVPRNTTCLMTELHKAAFQQSPVTLLSQTQVCCCLCMGSKLWVCHAPEPQIFWEKVAGSQHLPGEMKKNLSDTFCFIALRIIIIIIKPRWHSCVLAQVVLPSSIHPLAAGCQGKSGPEPPSAGDLLPGQDPTGNARATSVQL